MASHPAPRALAPVPAALTAPAGLRSRFWPKLSVAALLAAAGVVAALTLLRYVAAAPAYIDNGDGYYLYAAHRLAQGAVLYRDVMGTQPPLVYLLGAAIFKLGGTLQTVRLVSGLMRLGAVALVFLIGRRIFSSTPTAALAALLYALLPIGLTWDRSFDVNPPLTLVALLALRPFVYLTPRTVMLSGVLAAVALGTKNLYLPLLLATLCYLAVQRRALLRPYLLGLCGGGAAIVLALLAWSPVAPRDAFLGQQSSPLNMDWFVAALAYVAANDGGLLLVAAAGAVLCLRRGRSNAAPAALSYAPWLLLGSVGVLGATVKEGTAGPVFQFAEPAVALLAAYAIAWALPPLLTLRMPATREPATSHPPDSASWERQGTRLRASARRLPLASPCPHAPAVVARTRRWGDAARSIAMLGIPALVVLSLPPALGLDTAALNWTNAGEVGHVAALVGAHARPGTTILAPPYYALLTATCLPADAADTYILARRIDRGDTQARRWLAGVVADLRARRLPVVVTDLRIEQIGPLMAALRSNYHLLYGDTLPHAVHSQVWLPN
jgi:4-amino-4-deoxy-L-arabinose transferase-like glycosyltransferase